MNAIKLINAFWEKAQDNEGMKPSAVTVFFALFYFNNKCGWKEWFDVEYGEVRSLTGISKNTYYDGVELLTSGGYVQYKPGPNQYRAAKFKINVLYQNLGQHKVEQVNSTRSSKSTAQGRASQQQAIDQPNSTETIPKLINNKTIKLVNDETGFGAEDRKKMIKNAIEEFVEDPYLWEGEKEKKVAPKKEKVLPSVEEVIKSISESAHWRNALSHYSITEVNREKLFKRFYETKEDLYKIRYPTISDMAQNFYFWIKSMGKMGNLTEIIEEQSNDGITAITSTSKPKTSTSDKHAELQQLVAQSTEFMRRAGG